MKDANRIKTINYNLTMSKNTKKVVKIKAWGIFSCETGGLMRVFLTEGEAEEHQECDYIKPIIITYNILKP